MTVYRNESAADGTRSLKGLLADWRAASTSPAVPAPPDYDGPDVFLTHLTEKTSEVTPGAGFVARLRSTSDGHPYIGKAITNGASLILAQRSPPELDLDVPEAVAYLQVADSAETLSWLAAAWEGFPSRQLLTIGITGTDGKTSTANILFEILNRAGIKTGLLSTVRAVIGGQDEPLALHVTTPEAPVVQRHLRRMVDAGLTHCILESTSHGLAQFRVASVEFDAAVVTNITHEHLDYHGSYEAYFGAKATLFQNLSAGAWDAAASAPHKRAFQKTAVLNRDDDSYAKLQGIPAPARLSYGLDQPADVTGSAISFAADRTRFTLHIGQEAVEISSLLVGRFNIYNMLAAAAMAHQLGLPPAVIKHGLEAVTSIDGRMQRINRGQPFLTIVDFAHTPNALKKAIEAARGMTEGRTIALFGSAGKRDVEKRKLMAEISAQEADLTILTAEDPRTERLEDILEMMAGACREQGAVEGEQFWRIPDRGQAIYFALTLARPQDLLLICGKGHEQSMCFDVTEYPWDDREATRTAIDAFLQDAPMPDLGLPTFQR